MVVQHVYYDVDHQVSQNYGDLHKCEEVKNLGKVRPS